MARASCTHCISSGGLIGRARDLGFGRARDLGFPIEDIRLLLALWTDRKRSSADVKKLALSRVAELRQRLAVLNGMCRTLEHLANSCHGDDRPDCPILDDLDDLDAGRS